MATLADLNDMLVEAYESGDKETAGKVASMIQAEEQRRASEFQEGDVFYPADSDIPVAYGDPEFENIAYTELEVPGTPATAELEARQAEQEKTAWDHVEDAALATSDAIKGAVEVPVTVATGMGAQAIGIGAFLKNAAEEILSGEFGSQEAADRIRDKTLQTVSDYTYQPRTETGKEIIETVGDAVSPVAPALVSAQGLSAASTLPYIKPQVVNAAQTITNQAKKIPAVVGKGKQAVANAAQAVDDAVRPESAPTRGTAPSAGAGGVDKARLRQENLREIGVNHKLSKGEATRDPSQWRFEKTVSKTQAGEKMLDHQLDGNYKLQQRLDKWIDETGSGSFSPHDTGASVATATKAVVDKMKTKVRTLYTTAYKSKEGKQVVKNAGGKKHKIDVPEGAEEFSTSLDDYINNTASLEGDPYLTNFIKLGKQKGFLVDTESGAVIKPNINVADMERLRTLINEALPSAASKRDYMIAGNLKQLIDKNVKPYGGKSFAEARAARAQLGREFDNRQIVQKVIGTKPGSVDRVVALENLVDRVVLSKSSGVDDVQHLFRILNSKAAGEAGKQAMQDIRYSVLDKLKSLGASGPKDAAGVNTFKPGQVSKFITELDKNGKLDIIFPKKQAEHLRIFREVVEDLYTQPEGVMNHSETSIGLAEIFTHLTDVTAVPKGPVTGVVNYALKGVKDVALKAKVNDALKGVKK